jgi:hypothetical protein
MVGPDPHLLERLVRSGFVFRQSASHPEPIAAKEDLPASSVGRGVLAGTLGAERGLIPPHTVHDCPDGQHVKIVAYLDEVACASLLTDCRRTVA